MANDNPYLNTVRTVFGDDGDSDLRQSLIEGMAGNPDQAAKALPYAREKQIPLDMAERNLSALEEEDRFKRIDFNRLQKDTPMLGDFLRDRENARLAHDDIPFLEKVGKTFSDMPKALEQGQNNVTLGLLRDKQLRGMATADDIAMADAISKQGHQELGTGGGISSAVLGAVEQVPFFAETAKQGAAGGFIGAGTMAVVGQIGPQIALPEEAITVPAGFIAGSTVGAFNAVRSIEGGLAYDEFMSMKDADGNSLDPSVARGAATLVGITNGALELIPLKKLVKTVPGADKLTQYLTKDGIKQAMQFPGMKEKLADIGSKYAELLIAEGSTEMAQEAVTMYVGELAKVVNGGEFESPSGAEQVNRIASAGQQGMSVAAVTGGIGTTINTGRVIAQQNKQPDPEMVTQYLKNAKATLADPNGKLVGRSKEKTREYLNKITGGSDIYIDGEAVQTFYQSLSPEDQQALEVTMPDFAKRMNDAVQSRGDIAINRADFHTYMQPLDTKDWLDQNARFMPEHFSAADVAEYDSFMEDMYGAVADMAGAEEGEIVQNNFYNQLLQRFGQRTMPSGKTDVARMLSENPRAFFETMMERSGNDPRAAEILNRLIRDVEVQRKLPENLGAAMQRDDFDLMIDRLRNGTSKKPSKSGKKDLFGQTKEKKTQAVKSGPKPLMDALSGMGGIKKGSAAAKRLAEMDITPKRYPKLFSDNGIEDLGTVALDTLQGAVGDLMHIESDTSTDAYYADAEWLAEQLTNEDFGKGAKTQDQINADAEVAYMEDLERSIFQADIDLLTASNAEVKVALQRALDEQNAERDTDQTFNQDGKLVTDTPAFKAWFKDSKIVDEKGQPLVVYHGTQAAFESFDLNKLGRNGMALGAGFYFSNSKELASGYGETLEVYLSAQNPTLSIEKKTITKAQVKKIITALEKAEPDFLSNYGDISYEGHGKVFNSAVQDIYDTSKNDADVITSMINVGGVERDTVMQAVVDMTGKDGFIVHAGIAAMGAAETDNVYTVLLPSQIKSVDNRGTFDSGDTNIFNQGGNDPQGSISFTKTGKAIIRLFEKEDLSTVLHELGHLYWRTMTELAALDNAPEQIRKDVETMRAWVGAKDGEALTVEQEEKVADGFLAYLREGKAPSADLQTAFSRFKGWMTRLYRGIRDTLPNMNNDVRGVFDRMLATDDAIEALGRQPVFQIDTAIMGLLPKTQAEAMQRKMDKAVEDAKNRLLKKSLRQSEQRNTAAWKEAKEKLESEIAPAVDNEAVYRAIDAIREAGGLNRSAVVKEHGKEMLPYLTAHTVRGKGSLVARMGGADPSTIAALVGYRTGKELLQAIMNAPPKKKRVDDLVEEELLARYGDMMNDGTIEREALEAMHNELRLEVLEMEKDILADLAKIPAPTKDGIKAKAIQIMAESKVKEILPQRRLRSENKAYFDYGKALGKKDYVAATRAKAQQILNHHLYRMSLEAQADIEKKMKAWRRLLNRTDEQIGRNKSVTKRKDGSMSAGPDLDYVYAARAVLAKYGIGSSRFDFQTFFDNLRRDDPDVADTLLQAYAMLTQGAPDVQVSAPNVRGVSIKTAPYKNMAWADFQALSDAVDNLIEVGREQKFIQIQGQRIAKQEALDELSAQTATHKDAGMPTVSEKWGATDKARQKLWNYASMTTRVQKWARDMDNQYDGVFRKFIWQPVQEAITAYRDSRKTYMDKIVELLKPHKDRLHGDPIDAPELLSSIDGKGYTFENKAELVGMMAHLGNGYEPGSNGYKLLVGNGWARFDEDGNLEMDSFKAFMQRMFDEKVITKEDMDLIQSMWNLMEELKPSVWKAHKRMYGFYPNSVTSVPFMTPYGEYKGGYWPAIVDRTKSRDAESRENKRIAENENNITAFPSTGRGATKSRVDQYAAPLEMSLRLLPSHVDWAVRFVHIEPAIKDVAKLLLDKDFAGQLERVSPGAVDEMLFPWLQRSARQTTETPVQGRGWRDLNNMARWARQTTGVLMMAGNVINIVMQTTGIFPLIFKTGAYNFGRAWVQWAKSPSGMTEAVNEASGVMRHAQATFLDQNYQRHVQRLITGYTARTKMEDISEDFGYIGQKLVQNLINNVGWTAAYNKAFSGSVKEIEQGDDAAAIRYADSIISETQGFNNAENISRVEAANAMGKLFLVFYSYFNNQGNFLSSEVKSIARSDSSAGAKAGRYFYFYLMCYAAPSFLADIIGAAMRGNLPDDDDEDGTALDEWFQFYLMSQARYAAATVPYFGQLANYALGKFTDAPFDDSISASPVFSMFEKAISAPFSVWNAAVNDGDASKAVGDTLTAVGMAPGMGMLSGFAMRPAKYVADVAEGDSEANSLGDIVQGVSSGRAAPED